MTLIEEIEKFFGSNNLYDVLNLNKDASEDQIKKAYRKVSLKVHPDRVDDDLKEEATKKFQTLAQVHYVLSDSERRRLYDDHGIIANEDSLESEADWVNYWRLLFPKVTEKDITGFMDKYIGSKDEEDDLIKVYNRYEGDLDKICESHIGYDEERTVADLKRLLKAGKIESFDKFVKESAERKARRKKKAEREAKQAEKARSKIQGEDLSDLTAIIQRKSEHGFNSMIASLEAKYAPKKHPRGVKRKR